MIFYSDANEAHFHMNGSALSLVFKPRFLSNMLAITAENCRKDLHHVRESKTVFNSGFWIPHRGFQIPITGFQSLSMEIDSGSQNLRDSGFLELYSGFQNPGFQIPQSKISCTPESGFPHMRQNDFSSSIIF